jgi:hypothetical protein
MEAGEAGDLRGDPGPTTPPLLMARTVTSLPRGLRHGDR